MVKNAELLTKLRLGSVNLTVSNLQRSIDFYHQILGLEIHHRAGEGASLGVGEHDLVVLTEIPGAVKVSRRSGLYHFALLVPSRLALANFLMNLVETQTPIQGMSDHMVSEAIYLADPDGNGIEIYRDRPRSGWYDEDGNLVMGTEPLDPQGLLEVNGSSPWVGMQPGTVLGHMHLHVSNLSTAGHFYQAIIGLDLMASMIGSANFYSYGGYHHHVAINTWNGVGVPAPPTDSIGLRHFTIHLGDKIELQNLMKRLDSAQVSYEESESGFLVQDPSQNGIMFSA